MPYRGIVLGGVVLGLLLFCLVDPGVSAGEETDPQGSPGAAEEEGCDGHYTVMDDCSFVATQTTLEFVATACTLGSQVNCYGPSVVRLEVLVDGDQVAGCVGVKRFETLGPAACGGEVEVSVNADVECRVTGTAHEVLYPHGHYRCRTITG